MTTLAQLADLCQNAIADAGAGTWSQALVEEWGVNGIRDYAQHFPRALTTTLNCTADVRQYALPADFQAVLSIEYPKGQEPPVYLLRRPTTDSRFWRESGWYDLLLKGSPAEISGNEDQLIISQKPSAGQTIGVIYLADHDLTLAAGDTITVPGRHLNVIMAFVVWQAWRERTGAEERDPEATTLQLSQYQSNANAAERQYRTALAEALAPVNIGGYTAGWLVDGKDRIY